MLNCAHKYAFIFLLLTPMVSKGQFRNSNWCFGDSAGINFSNPQNPVIFESAVRSRGTSVSISGSNDSLLFYAFTRAAMAGNTGLVFNKTHQIMVNGNNIHGEGWYHEMVIIPFPGDSMKFYLFTNGVTGSSSLGLKYSVIDLALNNGLGEVVQKNVPLQNFPVADGITAIKHGNGRDWWIIFRPYDPNSQIWSNAFYSYLITPLGISTLFTQYVGTPIASNTTRTKFSKDGSKICCLDANSFIELYDFNRCTGQIDNTNNIEPFFQNPNGFYWSAEFSPSGQYLYVSAPPDSSYLCQFDLLVPNISLSKDTIWTTNWPVNTIGDLKRGPDDKIYVASGYDNNIQFPYPYADTVYNLYNMNLGVIHEPDSGGNTCNFQPWSFNLGGYRTYWGLPNNPDYEMGALAGSPCDSLTSLQEMPLEIAVMNSYYHTDWEILFINCSKLKGRRFQLIIYDVTGKEIFREAGSTNATYFTRDVSLAGKKKGIYIVRFETDREILTGKFLLN